MSLWTRMRTFLSGPPAPANKPAAAPANAPLDPGRMSMGAMPAVHGADKLLQRAGGDPDTWVTTEEILIAIEGLRVEGREAHALRLGRRVLARRPQDARLILRLAQIAADRADDDVAMELLSPLHQQADASVDALMLFADLLERKSDRAGALAAYERVLARSIDFPRAKERVARLREEAMPTKRIDATLLADGALTRGRYRLLREAGRGGAGTVFLADDIRTERKIALKVYHARGRVDRERLLREASTAAALEHSGVVRILDVDEEIMAIAMEWLPCGSVKDILQSRDVSLERAFHILRSLVDALAYVHGEGIVHRDLKPSNVLLRADDSVVLTDFGLARRTGELPGGLAGEAGEGTLAYMAPEQRTRVAVATPADVHALGVTIREVLGQVSDAPPPALVDIATSCLRADPNARPTLRAIRDSLG
ncbi:MAG: protein kinase [Sandaracinaceae bacterium]|nr:protein kinase [Sandaracinaceae bacterium]